MNNELHLYLIRHGIAGERGSYANDDERPLDNKGRKQTKKVARRLYDLGLQFDLILTSPLVRSRQTAEILLEAKLSSQIEESPYLAPSGDIHAWLDWLRNWRDGDNRNSLAAVGHEPSLSNWAELLVWGEVKERLILKKAGVIGLTIPESETPIGNSAMFWLTAPKFLLG
jgi:phosphohistidine phosphatase